MAGISRGKLALAQLGVAAALSGVPSAAGLAQSTSTTTFQVSATIQNTCVISANNLLFGPYTGKQIDVTTTIIVTCSATTPWNVGLNAGTGTGATVSTRKMTSGGSTLNYSLYRNAARTLNWGNTVGTDTLAGTATGLQQPQTVYGRIPGAQAPAPGTYADTITATITF